MKHSILVSNFCLEKNTLIKPFKFVKKNIEIFNKSLIVIVVELTIK